MNDDRTAVASVIDPWHRLFYDAMRRGDAPAIESLMNDDAVLTPPGEPTLTGSGAVRAWFDEYFKNFEIEELKDNHCTAAVAGDWAFDSGDYSIRIRPVAGGNKIEEESRFLNVWRQQPNQEWKVARMMWNSARPAAKDIRSGTVHIHHPESFPAVPGLRTVNPIDLQSSGSRRFVSMR